MGILKVEVKERVKEIIKLVGLDEFYFLKLLSFGHSLQLMESQFPD